MEFLRFLEGIRTPAATAFLSLITYCGSEIFFMAVAVTVFWCVSKRDGYYILIVGFSGTILSQFLKLWFRIPRPWVLDPNFTVVPSARPGATGYSFPSGHTQNIVGTTACVALSTQKRWVRAAAIALMILVPFSRMYLGCHTPLDVGVAFALALFLALALRPLMMRCDRDSRLMRLVLLLSLGIGILYWAFVTFYPFPADVDPKNLHEGVKNAYALLGSLAALLVCKYLDDRFLHFQVDAVWWAQAAKVALGLGIAAFIRLAAKAPLQALLPDLIANSVRYFLMVLFIGSVWPLTFPWFARLGRGRADKSLARH